MSQGCEAHLDPTAKKDPRKLGAHSVSGTDVTSAFDGPGIEQKQYGHEVEHLRHPSGKVLATTHGEHDDEHKTKADVAGALASVSPKHDDTEHALADTHPNKLRHKINSASATLEKHLAKDDHPLIKAAKDHLKQAKTHVDFMASAELEVQKKHHEEKATAAASKKASEDARHAAGKYETTKSLATLGKATKSDIEHAHKNLEHKKKAAGEKAAKHVKASTEKKNAESKLQHTKTTTAANIEAAVKSATVAAKTSNDSVASATKATAEAVKHHVGDISTHKVKTDCTFLDTMLLGELKHMPDVDPEFSCVGLGAYHADGHTKLGAIKCKPTPLGACPTEFTADLCRIVPLEVGNIHFKPLFNK